MPIARPRPYDLTTHDGKTVDWLTKAALMKAERLLGYELSITQGSYNAGGVSASAGTHDGGGAVDLPAWDWQRKVAALRLSGFAAWHRAELHRDGRKVWGEHIHAILFGNAKLSGDAIDQVEEFRAGGDGLVGDLPDAHSGLPFKRFVWPYYGPVGRLRWIRDNATGAARRKLNRQIDKLAGTR